MQVRLGMKDGDGNSSAAAATRFLDDPDPLFAESAVSVLGRIGGAARLAAETRVLVRAAIERVLNPR